MANPEHLKILKKGVKAWNKWRKENPCLRPDLSQANLIGMNLLEANFSQTNLEESDLHKANLSKADLRESLFSKADLSETNVQGANLHQARLGGAHLCYSNLSNANLESCYLYNANLFRAILCHANLQGANLRKAILHGANLQGAILAGEPPEYVANIEEADLREAKFTPLGPPIGGSSFLDLAGCEGFESARFSDMESLKDYLEKSFEYIHRNDIPEAKKWPNLFERAIKNIKVLRSLYIDEAPPAILIEVVRVISNELISFLKNHPKALYDIHPRQFEELVAEILASYGWKIRLTPPVKDGGYDIFAITKGIKPGVDTSWIIECKKYASQNKVDVDIVRALYGVKSDLKVANALLATTSYFTKGAKKFKASRYDIELKDYRDILEWINEYRPNPNGRLYIKDNKLILPGED